MGSALRDQALGIVAGCLQRLYTLVDAIRILLAAATLEDILHSLRILDLLGGILTAAEQSPVSEHLRSTQGDELRLHTAHREASHSAVPLVGLGEEVLVDMGDKLVDKQLLKLLGSELTDSTELEVVCQTVGHHHNERLDLAVGNEVVHYQSRTALI